MAVFEQSALLGEVADALRGSGIARGAERGGAVFTAEDKRLWHGSGVTAWVKISHPEIIGPSGSP